MTLADRLAALINAIGTDIKNLFQRVTALESASGGATVKQASINVPYSASFEYVGSVVDAGVTSNSKIVATLSCYGDEFDTDELAQFHLVVKPNNGSFSYCITSQGSFGGTFLINYLVG